MVEDGRVLLVGFAVLACWVEARGQPIMTGSGRVHSYWERESVVKAGGGSAKLLGGCAGAAHFVRSGEEESCRVIL